MRPTYRPTPDDFPRPEARRRSTQAPGAGGAGRWLADHSLAVGLLVALALALLSEMPWLSRIVRAHILQGLVVAFAVFLAVAGHAQEDLRAALRRGAAPWLLALLAWCVVNVVFPPARAFGADVLLRPYAVAELLRLFLCAAVFFAAAYGLRASELRTVVVGVLIVGTAVALGGLAQFGSGSFHGDQATSLFGNHEQFGSYIMLLLPVALAFALDRGGDQRLMLGAQAAAIVLAGALLLARTRSAWIGECLGLVALALLTWRYARVRLTGANRFLLVGPLLVLGVGFAMLLFSSQLAPLLSQRAATLTRLTEDGSFSDRLHRWGAACRMASQRPVLGWGLGSFPVIQERWTGQGDTPEEVVTRGTGHTNLAHNFWVQWAAETGGVGLALYVGTVVAFLLSAGGALKAMRPGLGRTLLLGCLAATVAACGDMAGAPSYTFPGVSALPWLWMGLGVAACRGERREAALPPTPPWAWAGAGAAGLAVAVSVLWVGSRQPVPPPEASAPSLTQKYRERSC